MTTTRHAIILVAGQGTRLLPFTLTAPKCFARVGETRILENALQMLAANDCEHVRIVIGHHADLVRTTITNRYAGMTISYIVNPIYETTNSMYSLALGLDGWDVPTWVIEGDVFFEPSLLRLSSPAEIAWYVDSTTRGLDGAFVEADDHGVAYALSIVRDLSLLTVRQSKSVGVLHLTQKGARQLGDWLQSGIKENRHNVYYDLIIADHLHEGVVHVVDVAGSKWFEIDTQADLEKATELFQ